jgi:hypothetical protein
VGQARVPGPGELLLALREQVGLDLAALVPADGGELASAFLATGRDGTVSVLKTGPDAVGDSAGRLRELVTGLRRRGYPAARLLASGRVAGLAFWLQERLPGTVLERVPVAGWLIPEVLRLNDAQAGLGDGTCQLSGLIAETLTAGGDGYCVHATTDIAGLLCGAHAQVLSAAELSIGRRVAGATRADVHRTLWQERTLVKTFVPRHHPPAVRRRPADVDRRAVGPAIIGAAAPRRGSASPPGRQRRSSRLSATRWQMPS